MKPVLPLPLVIEQLRGLRGRNVFNAGDVQDGAFDVFFGERPGVQLDANKDGVSLTNATS